MANGLLGAITDPAQVSVLGNLDIGRKRQARDLAGDILGKTQLAGIGRLARLDPEQAINIAKAAGFSLDSKGQRENEFGIVIAADKLIQAGLTQEAAQLLDQEAAKIEAFAGPGKAQKFRLTQQAILSGDQELLNNFHKFAQTIGPQVSAKEQAQTAEIKAKTALAKAQAAQTIADTKAAALETGKAAPEALLAGLSGDARNRASAAFTAAGGGKDGVKALNDAIKELNLDKTETTKKNVARISELSKGVKTREASSKKARLFLRAFQSGSKGAPIDTTFPGGVSSGAFQSVLNFLPGVFTDQGQFNEELDAFAEVAAREKLKAVGEIKPTDADVEGMKRALFGIGRDEETNINLLQEFIDEQEAQDDELEALRSAKKARQLSTFTGIEIVPSPGIQQDLSQLSLEQLIQLRNQQGQ